MMIASFCVVSLGPGLSAAPTVAAISSALGLGASAVDEGTVGIVVVGAVDPGS